MTNRPPMEKKQIQTEIINNRIEYADMIYSTIVQNIDTNFSIMPFKLFHSRDLNFIKKNIYKSFNEKDKIEFLNNEYVTDHFVICSCLDLRGSDEFNAGLTNEVFQIEQENLKQLYWDSQLNGSLTELLNSKIFITANFDSKKFETTFNSNPLFVDIKSWRLVLSKLIPTLYDSFTFDKKISSSRELFFTKKLNSRYSAVIRCYLGSFKTFLRRLTVQPPNLSYYITETDFLTRKYKLQDKIISIDEIKASPF